MLNEAPLVSPAEKVLKRDTDNDDILNQDKNQEDKSLLTSEVPDQARRSTEEEATLKEPLLSSSTQAEALQSRRSTRSAAGVNTLRVASPIPGLSVQSRRPTRSATKITSPPVAPPSPVGSVQSRQSTWSRVNAKT